MDQVASSVGGIVSIDFEDEDVPDIQRISYDLRTNEYALCIIDTCGDHAEPTGDYAAIPRERKEIAAAFGKEVLREADESQFFAPILSLRRIPLFFAPVGTKNTDRCFSFC